MNNLRTKLRKQLFAISSERITYLGIDLIQFMYFLYTEHNKTVYYSGIKSYINNKKQFGKYTKRWGNMETKYPILK